jgi:hypothetical protein
MCFKGDLYHSPPSALSLFTFHLIHFVFCFVLNNVYYRNKKQGPPCIVSDKASKSIPWQSLSSTKLATKPVRMVTGLKPMDRRGVGFADFPAPHKICLLMERRANGRLVLLFSHKHGGKHKEANFLSLISNHLYCDKRRGEWGVGPRFTYAQSTHLCPTVKFWNKYCSSSSAWSGGWAEVLSKAPFVQ